jgi:glucose-1-phosphate thymidylyltransferase
MIKKAIILAGGSATRLYPLTHAISKQLLPIYDKPMIYYPLSTIMIAGIKDILIITEESQKKLFEKLLGNGDQWGIKITYATQKEPKGIADAFIVGEEFIGSDSVALILGDNIFYGENMHKLLESASKEKEGATVFAYHVIDPERYGVIEFNKDNKAISIEEKPNKPKSNYVVTGLYFYDNNVIDYAKSLKPSDRGEIEITDINQKYLNDQKLHIKTMSRGYAWLDAGTHRSLLESGQFIASLEERQGYKISCPEEIAFRNNWITKNDLIKMAKHMQKNEYGKYLLKIIENY